MKITRDDLDREFTHWGGPVVITIMMIALMRVYLT